MGTHAFRVGEEVYHLGRKCVVKEHTGVDSIGMPEYLVVYLDSLDNEGYARESNLSTKPQDPLLWGSYATEYKKLECECGQSGIEYAKHSGYCPLYKKEV